MDYVVEDEVGRKQRLVPNGEDGIILRSELTDRKSLELGTRTSEE